MGEYLRSIGLYLALFVVTLTLVGFLNYYLDVNSMKQDTYKEIMYFSMNKAVLRTQGAEELYNGDIGAYYSQEGEGYKQLDIEIVKQLALASKVDSKLEYELLYNQSSKEYFLHIKSDQVDSVIKFVLERG